MIPKLYQKDGTTLIGNLTNCIECLVEEERNGIFEVTFQYPNTESIATSLVYDNIVICDANDTLKNQKFRIYDTRRMMNNTIEVYARHISFDLAYDYINSIDITNQSCEYALNTIFRSSQFSTGYVGHSDIINAQNYKISNCNALEAIAGKQGSIIDTYGTGAEILRDNTDIHVLNRRGNDNGVSIEYAKNLTGFELQEDTDDLITRIIPFATYTPEGGEQTRVQGTAVDSSYINNYSHPFISEIDFSNKFENNEVPTPAKLATMAQRYFEENKCDLPKQNWKIEFIPLSKCVGYEGIEDAISLCDTVTIKDTRYNINTKAKVIKTNYDVLRNRYESMELGEPRTTLGDIVNSTQQQGEQGPPGPQGPKGEDGNIGDFPDSVPAKPVLTTTLLGFASIQLDWTYDNKPYYWYEVYASKTKDFTPNLFDIVHKGQTSSFLYQAKPGETWYFRVCGINSYDHRGEMSDQVEVVTTLVDNLENYFTTAAIGQAVVGSLTADYMTAGIIKGNWIDAKNLSVTDGNGKRTLDIDSFGNVNLDVTTLRIASEDVATTTQMNSAITHKANEITSSVSGTYATKSDVDDSISFITDKSSEIEQKVDSVTYSFTHSYSQPNLLLNSNPTFKIHDLWELTDVYLLNDTSNPDKLRFYNMNSTCTGKVTSASVPCKGSTKYSIGFNYYRQSGVGTTTFALREYNSDGGYSITNLTGLNESGENTVFNKTITTKSSTVSFYIDIKTDVQKSYSNIMTIWGFTVLKGDGLYPSEWYPALQEVRSDTTVIDENGVTVKYNTGDYCRISSNGFMRYINNTGHTYRSLLTAGSVILTGSYQESFTITLPSEFDNIPKGDLKLWWSMESPKYSYGVGEGAPPYLLSEVYMPDGVYTDWTKNSSGNWTVTSKAHYKVYEYSNYIRTGTHNTECIGFVINYYVSA